MLIRDVMTTNVVTIASNTSLADARRIMDAHRIRRIPVVDKGKLVGIVNKPALDRAGPSQLTTFSVHELTYLLSKVTIREVMSKDLVTISPTSTVEEGVALAQAHKIGALLVVEAGRLVGIATTNDFFYKMLNPILGIGEPGSRISVVDCCKPVDIKKALDVIEQQGAELVNLFTMFNKENGERSLVFHVTTEEPAAIMGIISDLQSKGFKVEQRER
ncbi:MAG: CBS and ACT domain-containing protein [Dehalococcoidia bacterium]|nr:CBS and ACT domain-containing protein [Dehalococcoidia bacterium]